MKTIYSHSLVKISTGPWEGKANKAALHYSQKYHYKHPAVCQIALDPDLAAGVVPGEVDALQGEGLPAGHVVGGHDEAEGLGRGQDEPRVVQVENQLPPRHVGNLHTPQRIR